MAARTPSRSSDRAPAVRLIHVGLGGWGRDWYRRRLAPFGDVDVVALVDQSAEALLSAQREFGVGSSICFASLEGALEKIEADAVLITASLPGHVPAARTAIEAGAHVLMEKPFAPSVDEARGLVALAARRERILMISQNYRYFPAPARAAELVASGEFGRAGVIHVDFRRNSTVYDERRARHYALPHPLLADMAIHHFDLMRLVAGADATRVRCHSFNPPWSHFHDDPAAEAVVEMENGVVVTYRGSWVSHGTETPWAGEWRIECERGEIRFTSRGDETGELDELCVRTKGRDQRIALETTDAADRTGSLTEFVRCVRTGAIPSTSGAANVGSIGLTYAAIEAASSGSWVTVER